MKKTVLLYIIIVLVLAACKNTPNTSRSDSYTSIGLNNVYQEIDIPSFGTHFYRFRTVEAGVYRIELLEPQTNMRLVVFEHNDLINPGVLASGENFYDECIITDTPPLDPSREYFLAIEEFSYRSGSYSLRVSRVP